MWFAHKVRKYESMSQNNKYLKTYFLRDALRYKVMLGLLLFTHVFITSHILYMILSPYKTKHVPEISSGQILIDEHSFCSGEELSPE